MAKFYGTIGYAETSETSPGIWEEIYTEHPSIGDVLQEDRSLSAKDTSTIPDIRISNRISIVCDKYVWDHINNMRYVKWMGAAWEISKVEVQRPRLILTLGSLYHIPETAPEEPESE